jgi:prepilin signal peptidase PulO-like enzyme (type II secretory pathway)
MHLFLIFYSLIFLAGIIVGSFLNVVIDRLPFNKSILYPPSHCPHCRHRLRFFDLVPIFSFFYLKRKCRYCKAEISWYYPFIETVTGLLFVLTTYMVVGQSVDVFIEQLMQFSFVIYLFLIMSIMVIIFFIDLKYGIIPFRVVTFALGVISVRNILLAGLDMSNIFHYLLTGICVFFIFFLLFYFTRGRAIGFGDVFYSLMMGYLLGFPNIVLGVYIAFLTGALISLILVLLSKKRLKGGTIPFGPFLVFGTIISLFWGDPIIKAILSYLYVL